MSTILKQIVKQAPQYFSAALISAVSSMLMTKYYTRALSPEEFGVLALYISLQQYLVPVIGLNFDNSAHRVFFDVTPEKRPDLHGTAFICVVAVFSVIVLFFLLFSGFITTRIHGNSLYLFWLLISVLSAGFANYFVKETMNYRRPRFVLTQALITTVVTHGLAVVLISYFHGGALARLVGITVGAATGAIYLGYLLFKKTEFSAKLSWNSDHFRRLSYYAVPSLVGIGIGAALQQTDRFLINHHLGPQKVGAYAVGLMIGQGFSLVTQAIGQALAPHILATHRDDAHAMVKDAKRMDRILWPLLLGSALIVSYFGDFLIKLLADQRYIAGHRTLPLVVCSYAIAGTYLTVAEVLNYNRIVWFWPIVSTVAFGVGALVNFVTIPRFGVEGAAYALFCSNVIYTALIHVFGRKYYLPLKVTLPFFLLVLLLGTLYLVGFI